MTAKTESNELHILKYANWLQSVVMIFFSKLGVEAGGVGSVFSMIIAEQ